LLIQFKMIQSTKRRKKCGKWRNSQGNINACSPFCRYIFLTEFSLWITVNLTIF
jgi:hypothetical protein